MPAPRNSPEACGQQRSGFVAAEVYDDLPHPVLVVPDLLDRFGIKRIDAAETPNDIHHSL